MLVGVCNTLQRACMFVHKMAKRLKSYFEILAHWPASIINRKLTSIFPKADMKEEEAWNQYKERKGTGKGSSIMDRDVQSKSIMN